MSHSIKHPLAFIIEDDQDLARIYAAALESIGFEVELITSGAIALDRLAEVAPALVILDINLPHVSGDNILRQFTTDVGLLDTRVMVITANATKAAELEGKADYVLTKPVRFDQLKDLALRLVPSAFLGEDREDEST